MDTTGSINTEALDAIENEEEVIDDSEERELVTDSCSTKVLSTGEQPRDNYSIVYILFYLFGITSLVPWNFVITANDVSRQAFYFFKLYVTSVTKGNDLHTIFTTSFDRRPFCYLQMSVILICV